MNLSTAPTTALSISAQYPTPSRPPLFGARARTRALTLALTSALLPAVTLLGACQTHSSPSQGQTHTQSQTRSQAQAQAQSQAESRSDPQPETRPLNPETPVSFPSQRFSGFLSEYSKLRTSPRHPTTLYEQSARLADYKVFMIDPIVVLPTHSVRGERITSNDAQTLSLALRAETIESLSVVYTVVDQPGPGVARIRAAITAIAGSHVDPVTGDLQLGGASIEAEILDSLTNVRLGAAVESDIVQDANLPMPESRFTDAKLVFRHWAVRMNLWIRDAAELATHP